MYGATKAQHDELLAEIRTSAKNAIDQLVADDSNSINEVAFDDGMSTARVSVAGARFSQLDNFLVLAFYIPGAMYQQFAGVASDDVDVVIEFVDESTGEVPRTGKL